MRAFDFHRGVLGLDEPTRRAWSAIYAEGHEPGGPNPLAAKIAIAGMDAYRAGPPTRTRRSASPRIWRPPTR